MIADATSVNVAIILAAVLVAFSSAASAYIITAMTNKQRRREMAIEEAHRERLAGLASQQTNLLISTNEAISARTAADATTIEGKLDVIHGLVNSGLTAAKQSEFEALTRELATLRELAELQRAAGRAVEAATTHAIEVTEQRRAELEAELRLRREADETARLEAEAQITERNGG